MPSFQIEQFERSDAAGETVAIRIDGRWLAEQPEVVSDPILLIRNGSELARIEPAPGSGTNIIATPAGEHWGADFMVPSAAVTGGHAGYALEIAGGMAFALPEPTATAPAPSAPAMTAPPPAAPVPSAYEPVAPAPAFTHTPAAPVPGAHDHEGEDHELIALQDAVKELQARLENERRARRGAEDQLEQEKIGRQRDVAAAATAPTVAHTADGGELEAARAQIAELQQRVGEAERQVQTLEGALETTRQAHAQASAQALQHEATIAELQSGANQALSQAGATEEQVAELEARATAEAQRAAQLEAELTVARQAGARLAEIEASQADSGAQLAAANERAEEAERRLREASAEVSALRQQNEDAYERERLHSEARDTAQRHAGALQAEVQALAVRLQDAERIASEADRELQEASAKLEATDERLSAAAPAAPPVTAAPIEPAFTPPVVEDLASPVSTAPPIPGAPPSMQPAAAPVPAVQEPAKRRSFRLQSGKPKDPKPAGEKRQSFSFLRKSQDPKPEGEKRQSFSFLRKSQDPKPTGEKRQSFSFLRKSQPNVAAPVQMAAQAGPPPVPGVPPASGAAVPPAGTQLASPQSHDAVATADQAKAERRNLNLLLIVLFAAGALLAAEANGLIQAWPLNP